MRLLFVQDSLGSGGAEKSNSELWKFLRNEKKEQIKVVVLEHRKIGIEEDILKQGFDVTFLSNLNFLQQVFRLRDIISSYKPDIVHSVLFKSIIRVRTVKLLLEFYHIESLVSCSYSPVRFKDPKINSLGLSFYKYMNRVTHYSTDLFIALTEEVKNHNIEHLNINSSRIEVIPRGRAKNDFLAKRIELKDRITSELKIDEDSVLIVHIGRQEYAKGHLNLLKAIKAKDQQFSQLKVKFLFCGREGKASLELKKFSKGSSFKTETFWLGHRKDVEEILVAADIFVFPSLFEGLGGALIEAQAAGLPILCSDIKVFEEVVEKDENALFFESTNYEDLADKLLYLIRSEEKRQVMGEKSLMNFQRKFNIDDVHNRMYSLYKTVLS